MVETNHKYVLTGDLGGTQVRMSLFDINASEETPVFTYNNKTKDSKTLEKEILAMLHNAIASGILHYESVI